MMAIVQFCLHRISPHGLTKSNKLRVYKETRYLGFEILTAVVMKITIFWDITLCSPLKVKRRCGGTYHDSEGCAL
jgi:hypothetical protein